MSRLATEYRQGTHRLVPPEQTLARIQPILSACGITRCAEVTQLDEIGIPVYCAIRPTSNVIQVTNGKGLTHAAAKVSALMEGIELCHAEKPDWKLVRRASEVQLRAEGQNVLLPRQLDGYRQDQYDTEDFVIPWVKGEDLLSGEPVWAPASAVYFNCWPALVESTSNGLASGNHLIEATLHALYELIERDAGATLAGDSGKLRIKTHSRVVDTSSIQAPDIRHLVKQIENARSQLVLLHVDSCVPVYTFWAILLHSAAFAAMTSFNIGWGTHRDKEVAAVRAITEAAQSRLTAIHGSREDILIKPVYRMKSTVETLPFRYFSSLESNCTWDQVSLQSSPEKCALAEKCDLREDYDSLLHDLRVAGREPLVRFDLTDDRFGIPVVKVIAPKLRFNHKLY